MDVCLRAPPLRVHSVVSLSAPWVSLIRGCIRASFGTNSPGQCTSWHPRGWRSPGLSAFESAGGRCVRLSTPGHCSSNWPRVIAGCSGPQRMRRVQPKIKAQLLSIKVARGTWPGVHPRSVSNIRRSASYLDRACRRIVLRATTKCACVMESQSLQPPRAREARRPASRAPKRRYISQKRPRELHSLCCWTDQSGRPARWANDVPLSNSNWSCSGSALMREPRTCRGISP